MINAILYCAILLIVQSITLNSHFAVSPRKCRQQGGSHLPDLSPKYITAVSGSRRTLSQSCEELAMKEAVK